MSHPTQWNPVKFPARLFDCCDNKDMRFDFGARIVVGAHSLRMGRCSIPVIIRTRGSNHGQAKLGGEGGAGG
jgi:hypothetical protein